MKTRWIPLVLSVLAACGGEEEPTCVIAYDGCDGGNACEPLCVFSDEVPDCDLECAQPNDPPGNCELFANQCEFR